MDSGALAASTDQDLADAISQLAAIESTLRRQLLAVLAEYDRRGAWKRDGCRSVADVLVSQGWSRHQAMEAERVAARLEDLPEIAEAFNRGRLTWDQVRPLTHVASPESDAKWSERAHGMSVRHLQIHAAIARRTSRAARECDERDRFLDISSDTNGNVTGRLRLPAGDGQTVVASLSRYANKVPADPETGQFDPLYMRLADALVAACGALLADDGDPDRATVVITAPYDLLFGDDPDAHADVDGFAVSMEIVHRYACGARWQFLVEGPNGEPVAASDMRTPPASMIREARRRDRGCRFPGCGRKFRVHVHHITHRAHGGPTRLDNLCCLCPYHHRLVHKQSWRIQGDPNFDLRFISPRGKVFATGPPGLRDDVRDRLPLIA